MQIYICHNYLPNHDLAFITHLDTPFIKPMGFLNKETKMRGRLS